MLRESLSGTGNIKEMRANATGRWSGGSPD